MKLRRFQIAQKIQCEIFSRTRILRDSSQFPTMTMRACEEYRHAAAPMRIISTQIPSCSNAAVVFRSLG
ncbi:hypothetical protein PVAP13_9KG252713 [Panicum virgatum]|uniref:Uncharacterized protein n=1 Tax=Panicum virgatum TaxID=38727 RepID=A0A8T0NLH2_PANVG|nr:hypothetical protein PVAP13_9KG252713 [Panicum virgatum]